MNFPIKAWIKKVFPFCRSITGDGLEKTLAFMIEKVPELKIIKFKTGTKVFDWSIPKVWNIRDAYIENETGEKYAQFKDCNLHVVSYSCPVNKHISRDQLEKKIFTHPDIPEAIPYITSYYNVDWGFCMSEIEKKKINGKKFRVFIDSYFSNGYLKIGESKIVGKKKKEIFFSTNICHPSMANNELSGPMVQLALILYLKKKYPKPNYSYRFVFLPETIGSIAYLSKKIKHLKKNVIAGFTLSCVGDDRNFSVIESRNGDKLSDEALKSCLINENYKIFPYLERGSDERQYCWPGVDLPVSGFCRTKYGEYKEYHTSLDDLSLVTDNGLNKSFDKLTSIIDAFELGIYPKTNHLCEPNLSNYDLYPNIGKVSNRFNKNIKNLLNLLAYCDGKLSVFEIANKINYPLKSVLEDLKNLRKKQILKIF